MADDFWAERKAQLAEQMRQAEKEEKKREIRALRKALEKQADYFSDHDAEDAWRVEGFFNPKKLMKDLKKKMAINECPYDCSYCRGDD